MEYNKNKVPLFNGNKYALWSGRMQVHLLAQGYEVWEIIDKGFTLTQDEQDKKNMVYDAKAKDLIISGLIEFVYLKCIDETTNTLKGLGEPVETKIVVRKILRTLTTRFNPKVDVLEDRSNLTNLNMDEFHGILTTYEMRIEEEDGTPHLETSFSTSKKNESHVIVVKRILRYLKGTIEYGLWYPKGNDLVIQAYTDVDWEGSVDDCKSTSGATFYLGGCILRHLKGTIEYGLWYPKGNDLVIQAYTDVDWVGSVDDRKSTSGATFYLGGCILRYLKGTIEYRLWYPKGNDLVIQAYTDADWEGSVDDRKSTSGATFYLGGCLISWLSKRQSSISLSTIKVEYVVTTTCCTQVLCMKQTLQYLQVKFDEPIPIFCDNNNTISISKIL
eukprot:PITA_30350